MNVFLPAEGTNVIPKSKFLIKIHFVAAAAVKDQYLSISNSMKILNIYKDRKFPE